MTEKPTYEELEKRVAQLERQVDPHHTEKLQYPPDMLSVLMAAFQYIPLCQTFEDAARQIFDQCKRLTGARSGYVALVSENGEKNEVLFLDAGGMPCDVDPDLPMPIRGLRETAYKTNNVVFDNAFPESPWMKYLPEKHVRLDNVLFAPLTIEHKPVGVIGIANKPGGFNEQDVHISKILGDLAAVALTYAKAQSQLKNSEKLFKTIFDQAAVGIAQVTPDGRFISVNAKFADITGYAKDELTGMHFDEMTYPEDLNKESEMIGRVLKGETDAFEIEKRYIHKHGHPVWVRLYSNVVRDEKDNIQYAVASIVDITHRKQTEKKLKTAHEKMLTILNGIDSTVYVADFDTYEILFMNKKMITDFGGDKTGGICFKEFRKNTAVCDVCTNKRLIDENGRPAGVCTWHDQNPVTGRFYINHDRAVEWVDGRLVRLQVATDITDLKKMEARLMQAQKLESIGSLAGGIAHDFNNLLFPIVGISEMMLDEFAPGSPEHYDAQQICKAGNRGRALVQQILSFSRQSEQHLTPVHIQKILKEVFKLCRATIPADIPIARDIQTDCRPVLADPTRIHQIAMNLITNAYHAVEPTGGSISIQLKEITYSQNDTHADQLESGAYAMLTVSDTGTGIDPAILDKIFDPYFTTKEKGRGTGLGLATVYGIVKAHGGDIRVYSEVGEGACFHVYLPVLEKPETMDTQKQRQTIPKGTEHILLVDDEPSIVHLEKQMLERLGYRITSFTGSKDALAAFETDPSRFDLVITDMHMPELTGVQLAKKMIAVRPALSVILCTGFSESIDKEKTEDMGIKGLLMKPVGMMDLAHKVREVIDKG
jgi:PAS domain S-box-containing protein